MSLKYLKKILAIVFCAGSLVIGVPFENRFKAGILEIYNFLGADVSITPFTYDMSIIKEVGPEFYKENLYLEVFLEENQDRIDFGKMNLYTFKIPLLLCFEYLSESEMPDQCVSSICNIIRKKMKLKDKEPLSFALFQEGSQALSAPVFKTKVCNE